MDIILAAGQMLSGKDTLSDYLKIVLNNRHNENYWQRESFAKEVKKAFMDIFKKDAAYVEKWKVVNEIPPDLDVTVRKALQIIGDGFRQIKDSIWIDLLLENQSHPMAISDGRYINELKEVKSRGGFTVLVINPFKINQDPNESEAQMRVFSEFALKYYRDNYLIQQFKAKFCNTDELNPPEGWEYLDYVIINDKTKEDFHQRIDEFVVPEIESFFKEVA